MAIDKDQMRDLVRDVLMYLDPEIPFSADAVELIMLTMAQESHMGTYIKQLGTGPAKGVVQMEPSTEEDIWDNYLRYKKDLATKVRALYAAMQIGRDFELDPLRHNLAYQIAMARVHYRRVSDPLPKVHFQLQFEADGIITENSVKRLAEYWKEHYNTPLGKGKPEEAVYNYVRFAV